MASPTDAEMLESIRTAIKAIVDSGTQTVSLADGRSLTRLDLPKLMDLEREYAARVATATAGSNVGVVAVRQPG